MIVKDRHGRDFNTEYAFAVERDTADAVTGKNWDCWTRHGKYKTQKAMLQALKDIRKNNDGKVFSYQIRDRHVKFYYIFRPVHLNFDVEPAKPSTPTLTFFGKVKFFWKNVLSH